MSAEAAASGAPSPASAPSALDPQEGDPSSSPLPGWPWWTALVAIAGAFLLAAVGALIIDLPAVALGAHLTSEHTPAGLTLADTAVQDLAFVVASVYAAHLGGRAVRSWQFGLRPPGVGWRRALLMVLALIVVFLLLDAIWSLLTHPGKEKLLEQLGSNEGTLLLVLSAALTCVMAPMCEEFLFRGMVFTSLRPWGTLPAALITGLLFGGVHATSAPAADLLPLAALGFGLCLLYRYTGSLYPGMAAHSLNNCIAFAALEGWSFLAGVGLTAAGLAGIALVILSCRRAGLIEPSKADARAAA